MSERRYISGSGQPSASANPLSWARLKLEIAREISSAARGLGIERETAACSASASRLRCSGVSPSGIDRRGC
jgi:hypothetical protein